MSHYVYSSVGSADRKTGIPHFESKAAIERHLEELGLPLTIVRPVYFMENFLTFATMRTDEGLIVPVPLRADTRLKMVAVDDVAAIVGIVFADPKRFIGTAFDIAGDELTFPAAAQALGAAVGEPVRYVQVPWESVRERGEDFYLMYDWFERTGYHADVQDTRDLHPDLLDFDAWLARGGARALASARPPESPPTPDSPPRARQPPRARSRPAPAGAGREREATERAASDARGPSRVG